MILQRNKLLFDFRGYVLVVMVAAWLAGILLAYRLVLPTLVLLACAGAFGILLILFYQDRQRRFAMLFVLCICLGAWRYTVALPSNDPHSITAFIDRGSLKVRGSVADEPQVQVRTRLLIVDASAVSTDGGSHWQEVDGQVQVETLDTALEDPYGANYGDSVELQGKLQQSLQGPAGVFASMRFPRVSVTDPGGNPVLRFLYHLRVTLATIIEQALPQPAAALLIAIVLGLSTPAIQPLKSDFACTATIHLIVPSGFKVTILAGLVASSTRIFYKERDTYLLPAERLRNWRSWLTTGFVVVAIVGYTVLSGSGPAAIRAGIMGMLIVIAPRLGRVYDVYTALAFAALGMSCVNPFVLWDVGFQLSFLGTLGIVMLTPYCQYLLRFLTYIPFGHVIDEIMAVTLAAQIATWPIVAITFQLFSFIAPFANLLTVPLLGVLIILGMLSCATGFFGAPLAWFCGLIVWPILWYTYTIVHWGGQIPGACKPLSLDPWVAWVYYLLLALLIGILYQRWPTLSTDISTHADSEIVSPLAKGFSRRIWRLVQLGVAIVILAGTGINMLMTQPNGLLTVTFLSVGPPSQSPQGEAILVRTPEGKTILIDGGIDVASLSRALDSQLPPWQRSLDIVLLTCPRQDHLAGLLDVVTRYAIGEVIDAGMLHPDTTYTRWRRTISERNLEYTQVVQGDTLSLGTTTKLQVLWPALPLHSGSNEVRDNGLIIQLLAPGLRMLLLGASAQSNYALAGLTDSIGVNVLQSDVVQIVGEADKPISQAVVDVLQKVHPSLLVITPAQLSAAQRKVHASSSVRLPETIAAIHTIQPSAQVGISLQITSDNLGWRINSVEI